MAFRKSLLLVYEGCSKFWAQWGVGGGSKIKTRLVDNSNNSNNNSNNRNNSNNNSSNSNNCNNNSNNSNNSNNNSSNSRNVLAQEFE